MQLPLSNIVNISVSATPLGVSQYNTSNIALFSNEAPYPAFEDAYKIYKEASEVADDFGSSSNTYKMALSVFSQTPNILANNGYLVIIPLEASETLADGISRTKDLVQYFGVMSNFIETEEETLAAGAVIQSLNKIGFFVQREATELEPTTGILDKIRLAGLWKSRGLYYGAETDLPALLMKASYASRGLSVVFTGSNTTLTMQLKDLATVLPDATLTQTLLQKAKVAGADVYANLEGVPKVVTTGTNRFFDQVYNLGWFVGALQVAGFNFLAQTATKIPQIENGMDGLKGAYRTVCEQAVTNAYCAPGRWTSPTTFGNQADLLENVAQRGYYIYSQPISQQLQADREERKAPLVQIALKEGGAIHTSTVIVNVNA